MSAASRKEAEALGETTYHMAKPCRRGHLGLRNLRGQCLSCKEEDNASRKRAADPTKPKRQSPGRKAGTTGGHFPRDAGPPPKRWSDIKEERGITYAGEIKYDGHLFIECNRGNLWRLEPKTPDGNMWVTPANVKEVIEIGNHLNKQKENDDE
jgi:hypothetical protein